MIPPKSGWTRAALVDIDLVICDYPGYNTFLSAAYMDKLELVLAPISTTAQDRTVMTRMGWLAQSRGWHLVFVPNNLRPSRARQSGLVDDLESGSFSVAPVRIGRWVSLQDSSEMGLGVCEYDQRVRQQMRSGHCGPGSQDKSIWSRGPYDIEFERAWANLCPAQSTSGSAGLRVGGAE